MHGRNITEAFLTLFSVPLSFLICLCVAELKKETRGQIFQQVCITVPGLDCLFHGLGGMRCLEKNSEELCKAALEIEANLGR